MADTITSRPTFNSVTLTPNPVKQKASLTVVVDVYDKEITFDAVKIYCGEKYAGEAIEVI